MWVVLWTDALLYLLIAAVLLYALMTVRTPHLREPWRQVFGRPLGMATTLVLIAFVSVAVLDSIHYKPPVYSNSGEFLRYGTRIISTFDALVTELREDAEKTYSAPFAVHLYVKQMVPIGDGETAYRYPRLKYGGAQLEHPETQRLTDIGLRTLHGIVWGLAVTLAAVILALLAGAAALRRSPAALAAQLASGRTTVAWRTLLVTLAALLVFISVIAALADGYHILGTDKIGQDVLYKTLKSIRTGVLIGTLTTLVMMPFALLLGPMAGYFRGVTDDIIQYVYTTLSSIPGVLLIVAAVLMLQVFMQNHPQMFDSTAARADIRLLFLCIILGITSWSNLCRILRAETLKLTQMEYVQAATALGVGRMRILGRHLLPNVMHLVLIQIVLDFSALVLAEAVLSYIGVGVDPSTYSWGNMINSARLEFARDPIVWWPLAAAFIFMLGLVLCANLFSDAVRDAFDPRLRRGFSL
ncbi:MAG: ABC transporter permease [Salinisphaera sp.]|nr:ABC transporter permease [Salinisphaera sp.]